MVVLGVIDADLNPTFREYFSYGSTILQLLRVVVCFVISIVFVFALVACVRPIGSFRQRPAGHGLYHYSVECMPYLGGGHRKKIPVSCVQSSMVESGTLNGLSIVEHSKPRRTTGRLLSCSSRRPVSV